MARRNVVLGVAAVVGLGLLSAFTATTEREAGACSCRGPEISLLGPDRVDDAPLNTKVRIEVPSSSGSPALPGAGLVLRVHGRDTPLATTARLIAPGGWASLVELTPSAPLEPSTQYEIATTNPGHVPETTVIGTFRTGTTRDASAPRVDAVGAATAFKNTNAVGSMCMVPGPWVTIDGVVAEDPGRPGAKLVFGVWLGDASGTIDAKKPPTALVTAHDGHLEVGQSSLCDPHGFPIPRAAFMWLGIAALDEAGNASTIRRLRVDLAGARQR